MLSLVTQVNYLGYLGYLALSMKGVEKSTCHLLQCSHYNRPQGHAVTPTSASVKLIVVDEL